MTNALDELRGLLDKATPGPWVYDDSDPYEEPLIVVDDGEPGILKVAELGQDQERFPDAALIVFLRNHAEDLLAVARLAYEKGWNEIDGKCWCDRSPEFEGMKHHPKCLAMKEAFSRLSPPSEEGS